MRRFKSASILAVAMSLNANAASATSITGTVNVVDINRPFNGLVLQLNVPLTATYESACPWNNWIFLPITDPFYPSILATLLAAQASGQTVVVTSGGCVSSPGGTIPVISTVDLGLRIGS
jgi:hypothetical protein